MMIASSMGPGREPLSCLRQSSSMVSIQGKAKSSKVICTTLKEVMDFLDCEWVEI